MLFGSWLDETLALQRDAYGQDPTALEGEEFAEFVRWNTLAAHTELSEFLQLIPWKPWSIDRGRPANFPLLPDGSSMRDLAVNELVDVLHFVANVLVALDVSTAELNERYGKKMVVNRERMASGVY